LAWEGISGLFVITNKKSYMRTVRYVYVAVKTQIPGGHARLPAARTGSADGGHGLVHSSGHLAITPGGAAVDTV